MLYFLRRTQPFQLLDPTSVPLLHFKILDPVVYHYLKRSRFNSQNAENPVRDRNISGDSRRRVVRIAVEAA